MSEGTESTPKAENPFTRPWFLVSGGVIVVILVLALVYALLPPVGAAPNGQPTPTVTTDSAQPSATSGDSICGLPQGDQTIPGPGLTSKWELNGKTAVPTAPADFGPGKTDSGARTCYAHNPTGALFAAANFVGTSSRADGQKIMIERLSAPSETRDKYLATPPPFSAPREGTNVQIAGFRIQAYSDHTAAVVVAIKNSQGGLGSQTLPLKWVQGDWKVDLSSFSPLSPIDDMADFVPWSGV